jgi:hypothetical protein
MRAGCLLELGEQGARPLRFALHEQGGGGGKCVCDHVEGAGCPRRLDQPVDLVARRLLAAGEAGREFDRPYLAQRVRGSARLECGATPSARLASGSTYAFG